MEKETNMNTLTETQVATKLVQFLLARGYALSVNDGEETTVHMSKNEQEIIPAMFTTDEEILYVNCTVTNKMLGYIELIYGNGADCVIHDCLGVSVEAMVDDFAELLEFGYSEED
jgi:hypothetical protein